MYRPSERRSGVAPIAGEAVHSVQPHWLESPYIPVAGEGEGHIRAVDHGVTGSLRGSQQQETLVWASLSNAATPLAAPITPAQYCCKTPVLNTPVQNPCSTPQLNIAAEHPAQHPYSTLRLYTLAQHS